VTAAEIDEAVGMLDAALTSLSVEEVKA